MSDRALTQHFSLDELACHDGTPYPSEWIQDRLVPLVAMLEVIRTACGDRVIYVVSGYRTEEYTAALAASGHHVAGHSQHVEGRAVDFKAEGMAASDVHARVEQLISDGRLPLCGGLGRYPGWTHVDIRPKPADGHVARWSQT